MSTKEELEVEVFNLCYPVGTKVSYWTGFREGGGRYGRTTYPAQLSDSRIPIVYLRDLNGNNIGAVALSHIALEPKPKTNLLRMPPKDTLLNYVLNDVELRGAAHLYRRAAYHLDTLHYHGNNQWDSAADAEAFVTLSAFATELDSVAKARQTPEVVQ